MQLCGLGVADASSVIQWHVLGMFVPSFFTGDLIKRFGVLRVMAVGVLLLGGHVAVALSGVAFAQFVSGLVLLGVGWNFLFIGVLTAASFSAGSVLSSHGWSAVNLLVLPMLVLALAMIGSLGTKRRVRLEAA